PTAVQTPKILISRRPVRAVRRLVWTEIRFAVTKSGLDGVADSISGMAAGQHGDAFAEPAAQTRQVLVQTTDPAPRDARGVSEQGGGTDDRTSFRSTKETRANYGTRGGNCRSESTTARTALVCFLWNFKAAISRPMRVCASVSRLRMASASARGSGGVAGPSPLPG